VTSEEAVDPWTTKQVAFGSFGLVQSRPIGLAAALGTGKMSGSFVSKVDPPSKWGTPPEKGMPGARRFW
jgi:hypothetical protein